VKSSHPIFHLTNSRAFTRNSLFFCGIFPNNSRIDYGGLRMSDYRVHAGELKEDQMTAIMESYSAKWPTSFFLAAAFGSILGSLALKGQRQGPRSVICRAVGRAFSDTWNL
jgi:hypothetical protein